MQYEYKTLPVTNDETGNLCKALTAKLSQAGKQGWELVSILSQNSLGSSPYSILGITQKQFLILKRVIETEVSP